MPITFNGKEVAEIRYNGTSLDLVTYNGVEVFSKGPTPTPDEYFTFTLLTNDTYEITPKNRQNMPDDVVIPSTYMGKPVTELAKGAFFSVQYPSPIKSIFLPNSIQYVRQDALRNCPNLTDVTLGSGLISSGSGAYADSPIKNVYYKGNINQWVQIFWQYGILNKGVNLYINNSLLTTANISTATEIKRMTLRYIQSLTTIVIGSNVKSIGDSAFYQNGLTSLSIPDNVTSIGSGICNTCASLESVEIGNGVSQVSQNAFYGCTNLKDVIIGQGVSNISYSAFYGCTSLMRITCKSITPPTIASTSFTNVPADCAIYVPSESVDAYKAAQYWSTRADYIQAIS